MLITKCNSAAKNERAQISAKPSCMGVIIGMFPKLLQLQQKQKRKKRKKMRRCDVIQKKEELKQMVQLVREAPVRLHLECGMLRAAIAAQRKYAAGYEKCSCTQALRRCAYEIISRTNYLGGLVHENRTERSLM